MWQKILRALFGLAVFAPIGCGQASGDPTVPSAYLFTLTPAEVSLARDLAENDWHLAEQPSGFKTLFIKVDLLPDSQAETTQRLVMVHHYRYQGDQTIFTMVDLHSRQILKREICVHYPTALAPVEVADAIR